MIDPTGWTFLAIATICFVVVAVALRTGRVLGVAFRSRFIARRDAEPVLYWMSVAIFAAFGLFLAYAVISVNILGR